MSQISKTVGIDIGKNSFHVVGHDERGAIVLRQKWSRGQLEARLPTCRRGLTPSRYQSGEINRTGAISRCGDDMMRVMLYEAAHAGAYYQVVMAQGLGHEDRQHRGMKKAIVALALGWR